MDEITCKITLGKQAVELSIEDVDSDHETSVFRAILKDKEGPLYIEYFELGHNMQALDIIKEAIQTIQNGVNWS